MFQKGVEHRVKMHIIIMDIKNMGHTVLVAITILALEYELQSMAFLLTHRMDHNNITTPHAC